MPRLWPADVHLQVERRGRWRSHSQMQKVMKLGDKCKGKCKDGSPCGNNQISYTEKFCHRHKDQEEYLKDGWKSELVRMNETLEEIRDLIMQEKNPVELYGCKVLIDPTLKKDPLDVLFVPKHKKSFWQKLWECITGNKESCKEMRKPTPPKGVCEPCKKS